MNYQGVVCPVCGKPLQSGDDIVVCPECGTPYHRDCYAQTGHCVHAAEHGNYEVKRTVNGAARRCPNCGADNPEGNLFCENCGTPMSEKSVPQGGVPLGAGYSGGSGRPVPSGQAQNSLFEGIPEPLRDAMGGATAVSQEYDGISAQDWAAYIGNSAPYYLFQFERMNQTGRKTSICWSALFLWPLYFFYRKVWNWAAAGALAFVLTRIPSMLLMLQELGALSFSVNANVLTVLSFVCMVANWALSVFFGVFAFYLFRQSAGRKIKALKEASLEESEYRDRLSRAGGPSWVAVVLVLVLFFGCSMALTLWIGPERLLNYMYY